MRRLQFYKYAAICYRIEILNKFEHFVFTVVDKG